MKKKNKARLFIRKTRMRGVTLYQQTRENTEHFEKRIRAWLEKTRRTIVDKKVFDLSLYVADAFSYLNMLSGLASIYFSIQGDFTFAIICIGLAILFDSLDGTIARALQRESLLGLQLDSFSDLVSFAFAASFLVLMKFDFAIPILAGCVILIGAGAYRLARYNVLKVQDPDCRIYLGTPITWNGVLFPALILLNASLIAATVALFLMGFLMVSRIRIKRPW